MNVNEEICMVIAHAGESRTDSVKAIELAKNKEFEEAEKMLARAREVYDVGHRGHRDILAETSKEDSEVELTYLLVHMSDILLAAELMLDVAKYTLELYKEVNNHD